MDINQFKAKLKGGGARPNLFRVILAFPLGVATPDTMEKVAFLCRATNIPGLNIGTIEVPFLGRQYKIAGDRTFDEWPLTIVNDTDFAIRDAFERWHQIMNGHVSNTGVNDPQAYMVDGVVQQLDRRHNVIKTYEMRDCWPSNVDSIDLSMDASDTIEEFVVTMQFQYFVARTTT